MVHQQVQAAFKSLENGQRAAAVDPLRAAVADKDTQAVRLLASILDRQEYEAKFFDGPMPEFTLQVWATEASTQLDKGVGFAGFVLGSISEHLETALNNFALGAELGDFPSAFELAIKLAGFGDYTSLEYLLSNLDSQSFEFGLIEVLLSRSDYHHSKYEHLETLLGDKLKGLRKQASSAEDLMRILRVLPHARDFINETVHRWLTENHTLSESLKQDSSSGCVYATELLLHASLACNEASNVSKFAKLGLIQGSDWCGHHSQSEDSHSSEIDWRTDLAFAGSVSGAYWLWCHYLELGETRLSDYWQKRQEFQEYKDLGFENDEIEMEEAVGISAQEFIESISGMQMFLPDSQLAASITIRHLKEIELPVGGLSIVADSGESWFSLETGFDCWAHLATVHETPQSKEILGLLVTTYGEWTGTPLGTGFVRYVETLTPGDLMPTGFMLSGISNATPPPTNFAGGSMSKDSGLSIDSRVVIVDDPCFEGYLCIWADDPTFEQIIKEQDLAIIEISGTLVVRNLYPDVADLAIDDLGQFYNSEPSDAEDGIWNDRPFLLIKSDFAARMGI